MKYIIIPTEIFRQADMELARKLALNQPRKSVDGEYVIMHIECYNRLFESGQVRKSIARESYPVYDSDSQEFKELMDSDAWTCFGPDMG